MERERSGSDLELPGFRFHPTDEELLDYYLRREVTGKKNHLDIIGTLNLYRYNPWELPGLAKIGERDWYFFVPRDRRQGNGGRPNRTTERGFWKATGSDRLIRSAANPKRLIGLKKTLVYYQGRAPRGSKTEWVMNEYRLPDDTTATAITTSTPTLMEDIVLCKIYRKSVSMKELEHRAAMEEVRELGGGSTPEKMVLSSDQENLQSLDFGEGGDQFNEELESARTEMEVSSKPARVVNLEELQIPKNGLEWVQDPFLTQLRSPWMLDPWSPYANVLNF